MNYRGGVGAKPAAPRAGAQIGMVATGQVVGIRHSQARDRVWAELASDERFRSAQDVHAALRAAASRTSLSTVYRNLQGMADAGAADVIQGPTGEALYRYCGDSGRHHHHLVCRECGRTTEVASVAVERWAARIAAARNYTDVDHTVELVGLCGDCARAKQRSAADGRPASSAKGAASRP